MEIVIVGRIGTSSQDHKLNRPFLLVSAGLRWSGD
jgi:hypothetical protein